MNIKNLNKAEVLLALYRGSRQQGRSFLGYPGKEPTVDDCREQLMVSPYVDYFFGRAIKCDLGGDTVDFWLYDRDYGAGAGERALRAAFSSISGRSEGSPPDRKAQR